MEPPTRPSRVTVPATTSRGPAPARGTHRITWARRQGWEGPKDRDWPTPEACGREPLRPHVPVVDHPPTVSAGACTCSGTYASPCRDARGAANSSLYRREAGHSAVGYLASPAAPA